jgi:2-polyprenyl-3-methyl-5-hydroxy-6-metoxy-1,4-benzoquinol methylase
MFEKEIAAQQPISWLDVGAGYGEFVEAVKGLFPESSRVVGIEPMEPKARAAQARGLAVSTTSLNDVEGPFDVISLINVFSHLPDFNSFGQQLAAKLSPNGVMFIETGNGGDLERRDDFPDVLYLPDHLVFAGVKQMTRMLNQVGFQVEKVEQQRVDSLVFTAKAMIKSALAGRPRVALPYTSPFRTVFYVARLKS